MSRHATMNTLIKTMTLAGMILFTANYGFAQSGTWQGASGSYSDSGNWLGSIVADGAGNTADFSAVDLATDADVAVNSDFSIGHMIFGDTNLASGGSWLVSTGSSSTITLDDAAPSITVNQLTPTTFDDAYFGVNLAGTNGLNKNGVGILTIGGDASGLTGAINVNEGTLRKDGTAFLAGGLANPIVLADGTTVETITSGSTLDGVIAGAAGANVTMRNTQGGSTHYMSNVQGLGTGETLNWEMGGGTTYSAEGDWKTGGWAAVNMIGTSAAVSTVRLRANGGGFDTTAFENTALNLTNTAIFGRTYSNGLNIVIGELSGDATAEILGGNGGGGSVPRYIIGQNNTSSEFAGKIVGNGGSGGGAGMAIEKVGTGTLTFSGSFDGSMASANGDIGRAGGMLRVSEGTLALTNTADNIPGGFDVYKTTVDVLTGATLDVSGTTSTFTSSPLQQIQGSGTIVGPFNHAAGELLPGNVSQNDNDSSLTNVSVPTAGAITFNGDLAFNGGTIGFDMNETPGGDDLIQVIGTVSVAGGGTVDPNFLGADPAPGQTYTFLSSSGGFSDAVAGWDVLWPGRGAKPSVFIDGFDLKFTTTAVGAGASIVWSGAVDGTWDIETTQNWDNGGPDTFFQGDDVTFNDTGANPAITLASDVSPRDVVVDSDTNNYTFTGGSISATGSLIKRGTSTLTLSNTNSFTEVTVEGGAIDTSGATGTLGSGPLTLAGGSIINVNGSGGLGVPSIEVAAGTSNTIEILGSGGAGSRPDLNNITGSGTLDVNVNVDNSWIEIDDTSGFSGEISIGPDGVNATSVGVVRVRGDITDFGNAKVNLSNLEYANQQGGSTDTVEFAFGELQGDAGVTLSSYVGGGTFKPSAIWVVGALDTDSVFDGAIVDGDVVNTSFSRVRKVGTGELELNGTNTYTGSTTILEGTLSLASAFLADTADVFVSALGILNLDHASTDDVNALYFDNDAVSAGVYGALGSGAANEVAWITGTGLLNVLNVGTLLPGDYNNDGMVDAADYTVWRDNLGAVGGTLGANDTIGGTIDSDQYDLWVSNFGATASPSSATAIPEPSSAVLFGLLMIGLTSLHRRS